MVEFLNDNSRAMGDSSELKFVMTDDSMAPMIQIGEILIVDKSVQDFGKVLVLMHDGKMTARRVKRSLEGGFELSADNTAYPVIKTKEIHIIGTVIATARG